MNAKDAAAQSQALPDRPSVRFAPGVATRQTAIDFDSVQQFGEKAGGSTRAKAASTAMMMLDIYTNHRQQHAEHPRECAMQRRHV